MLPARRLISSGSWRRVATLRLERRTTAFDGLFRVGIGSGMSQEFRSAQVDSSSSRRAYCELESACINERLPTPLPVVPLSLFRPCFGIRPAGRRQIRGRLSAHTSGALKLIWKMRICGSAAGAHPISGKRRRNSPALSRALRGRGKLAAVPSVGAPA